MTLPMVIIDKIFEFTDIETCIVNNRYDLAQNIFNKQTPTQKQLFIKDAIKDGNCTTFLLDNVPHDNLCEISIEYNKLDFLELVLKKSPTIILFTKCLNFACRDNKMNIIKYLCENYDCCTAFHLDLTRKYTRQIEIADYLETQQCRLIWMEHIGSFCYRNEHHHLFRGFRQF